MATFDVAILVEVATNNSLLYLRFLERMPETGWYKNSINHLLIALVAYWSKKKGPAAAIAAMACFLPGASFSISSHCIWEEPTLEGLL